MRILLHPADGKRTIAAFQGPFLICKNPSAKAKGLEMSGSSRRSIGRTFRIVFKLPNPKGKLKIVRRE